MNKTLLNSTLKEISSLKYKNTKIIYGMINNYFSRSEIIDITKKIYTTSSFCPY